MTRWAAAVLVAMWAVPVPQARAAATVAVNLKLVGHSDLGGIGPFDAVAAVGTTAIVSRADPTCAGAGLTVVDVKDPAHPRVTATLPVGAGLAVADLDAQEVTTAAFRGSLLAVALRACRAGAPGAGIQLYDVTRAPQPLGRSDVGQPQSVSVGLRPDGRVLVAAAVDDTGPATIALIDATDPTRPAPLARWAPPPGDATGGAPACAASAAEARLPDGGQRLLVSYGDGGVVDLDLAVPAAPVLGGSVPGPPGAAGIPHGAEVALVRSSVAVVTNGGCAGDTVTAAGGIRRLAVGPRQPITELPGVSFPGPGSPGRLAASGELAFVAWHAGGLRVLDLGQVQPAAVALFVPPAANADVVGVAVLARDLVVTDADAGLYVLERPAEGHAESLWSKIKGAAGFMSIPVIFGAIWAVPRLAMGHAPASSRSRVPARVGAQRRR